MWIYRLSYDMGWKLNKQLNFISMWNRFLIYEGIPFPKNFMSVIKVIFKRLFRVYAHIYHSHF